MRYVASYFIFRVSLFKLIMCYIMLRKCRGHCGIKDIRSEAVLRHWISSMHLCDMSINLQFFLLQRLYARISCGLEKKNLCFEFVILYILEYIHVMLIVLINNWLIDFIRTWFLHGILDLCVGDWNISHWTLCWLWKISSKFSFCDHWKLRYINSYFSWVVLR
jgi:hypothetical protein